MDNVRAKFECTKVDKNEEGQTVKFSAVVSGSPENESFFKFTPFGEIELGIVNNDIQFEVGKEYYLDFTEAN